MKCSKLTKKGTPCSFKAKKNGLCGRHSKITIKKTFTICKGLTKKGTSCKNKGKYDGYCGRHKNKKIKKEKKTCIICLDDITNSYSKLDCNHCYHVMCLFNDITQFKNKNSECPICKSKIPNTEYLKEEHKKIRNTIKKLNYKIKKKDDIAEFWYQEKKINKDDLDLHLN